MVKETILAVQEAEAQASGLVSEARQKGSAEQKRGRRTGNPGKPGGGKKCR